MKRNITNKIRFILDEILPPFLRDNKYFMYPFFYFWFKGEKIPLMMNFKSEILKLSDNELKNIYKNLQSRARDRITDLNDKTVRKICSYLKTKSNNLIDVGCGNGYLLKKIIIKGKKYGCDVFEKNDFKDSKNFNYSKQDINNITFSKNFFDIVICCHTLEHIPNINRAISELKRIAKKELIIVVPKQRYNFYTLDLHIHFFPDRFSIINIIGLKKYQLFEIDGDWLYIGYIS